MQIHDLSKIEDISLLAQGRFAEYEAKLPWFFSHYHSYWERGANQYAKLETMQLEERRRWVMGELDAVSKNAAAAGWDLANFEVVLFVGKGVSNGHAFRHDGRTVVWFALESYASKQQSATFVSHEFAHGLQYSKDAQFAFNDLAQKNNLGRQVLTEGFATFATEQLRGMSEADALWADFLSAEARDKWLQECTARWDELRVHAKKNWDADAGAFFFANDPKDIISYRAGYYVGARLVREYAAAHGLDWNGVARLSRAALEKGIRESLGA